MNWDIRALQAPWPSGQQQAENRRRLFGVQGTLDQMGKTGRQIGRDAFLATLRAHFVFMSDDDEDELHSRALQVALQGVEAVVEGKEDRSDVADLALRTCMCGARIDGFDEYAIHLERVFSRHA